MPTLDTAAAVAFSERAWEQEILPALAQYIRIPNKSPYFEPTWRELGHMARAVRLIEAWCREQPIPGLTVEVVQLADRSPVILMEVPATSKNLSKDTVLLYGHLDKQPEMVGWRQGLDPWIPVREGDRLYGRGGADDGYSSFASLAALRLLHEQKIPHARCVVLIEAAEESGSVDLPAYLDMLAERIGTPSLVVCLDSGCGNYDQLWTTTSLRGVVVGTLRVQVLEEGVHSGDASGIVASSVRIFRQLLSRIEDEDSGEVLLRELHVEVPPQRLAQARVAAGVLGDEVYSKFPWVPGMRPLTEDPTELMLNKTWRPALAIIGSEGMPTLQNAGNVLRPQTAFKLSIRIPPRVDTAVATQALKRALESNPPYGAKVTFESDKASRGWDAPPLAPWLEAAMDAASRTYFGKPSVAMGEGGTIPFMGMLGEKFPQAQFLITGVLGPHSNAHGPNEFLHVPTGKKLTCCVGEVIAAHARRQV